MQAAEILEEQQDPGLHSDVPGGPQHPSSYPQDHDISIGPGHSSTDITPTVKIPTPFRNFPAIGAGRQDTLDSLNSQRGSHPVPERPRERQLIEEDEPWKPKNILSLGRRLR